MLETAGRGIDQGGIWAAMMSLCQEKKTNGISKPNNWRVLERVDLLYFRFRRRYSSSLPVLWAVAAEEGSVGLKGSPGRSLGLAALQQPVVAATLDPVDVEVMRCSFSATRDLAPRSGRSAPSMGITTVWGSTGTWGRTASSPVLRDLRLSWSLIPGPGGVFA